MMNRNLFMLLMLFASGHHYNQLQQRRRLIERYRRYRYRLPYEYPLFEFNLDLWGPAKTRQILR
jgi:hypothetical protein